MTVSISGDKELFELLRKGDEDSLVKVYQLFKGNYISWGQKNFLLSAEECEDIFQDAIIAFNDNIRTKRLTELNCSLKTYIFSIAKNLTIKRLNNNSREELKDEYFDAPIDPREIVDQMIILSEKQQKIMSLLKFLKEPCYSILKLYYYKSYSMEIIARELNYKNEKVVKSQKVRCMNELKKLVKDRFSKGDLG
ncbi:MAG: sigma-70 family RNA polymerase sigma factor [Flammeovirgaceae bacterium]|nr:sigma-70 family RNA polymerase sigma factor [Flammeovirgaceae bacterium]